MFKKTKNVVEAGVFLYAAFAAAQGLYALTTDLALYAHDKLAKK